MSKPRSNIFNLGYKWAGAGGCINIGLGPFRPADTERNVVSEAQYFSLFNLMVQEDHDINNQPGVSSSLQVARSHTVSRIYPIY